MRVQILGPLRVVADGRAVDIGGARLRALVTRLAVDAGRAVTVEALSGALWPESGPADPGHALQALVSRLRRALPDAGMLRSVSGGYRLDLVPDAVDALAFERLVRTGQRALREGDTETAARRLREGLGLWRGSALADARGAPYAVAAAARLDELRLAAIEDRIAADLATGAEHLVAELQELTAAHPLRERLYVLLVRALHADGRQSEALGAYAHYRALLADALGVDPGPELRAAHGAVLRDERVAHEPGGGRPRGNLRAPLTSFVGRAHEQARVRAQLRDGRLVTLVGPGGAGKTRLAVTVAAGLADAAPDGVWLVELAAVTDPADVPQAAVSALGLRETGLADTSTRPHDPVNRLVAALSGARALLVLDNCEHVIDAAARLIDDLLGRCPRLRVLATSREPLAILGEALCAVPPLALPEPGATAEQAAGCPAVRLFVDRAGAVRADFALTEANVGAVTEVCRRLDGLPLAIELAAARVRSMAVDHLAGRLDDRFQLLTGGSRTAMSRHRTLHAVVAWSWDLLDPAERAALERLAVFPASFDAEAAACLGATPSIVDALVDQSLIQVPATADGGPRYQMLETIREYGLERLAESGEIAAARAEHAACFLALAEAAAPHVRGADQLPWIARLTAERDNVLAALHFVCDAGDAETAVRFGAALWYFWAIHSEHVEAADRLRAVLAVPGPQPVAATAAAATGYLFTSVLSGDLAARTPAPEAIAATLRAHDPADPTAALIAALLALIAHDPAAGLVAIDAGRAHADPWTRAMLCWVRSFLHGIHGDVHRLCHDLAEAAAAFRAAGERWGLAMSLLSLANARIMLGDLAGGVGALEESAVLVRMFGVDDHPRLWLAMVRIRTGDVTAARDELLGIVARAGSGRYVSLARLFLGDLARCAGDRAEAARQFELAAADREAFDDAVFRALYRFGVGTLAVQTGDFAAAERDLGEALTLVATMPELPMAAPVGLGVARLRLRRGIPPRPPRCSAPTTRCAVPPTRSTAMWWA